MRTLSCSLRVVFTLALCVDARIFGRTPLEARSEKTDIIPAPIVVPPSQVFEGVDGSWSTFIVRVGTPPQSMRVIASTNSPDTIVVRPDGCSLRALPNGVPSNCAAGRGGTFNSSLSSSWAGQGWFALNGVDLGFEANLGYNFNLSYGLDRLGLGFDDGDAPVILNQTIAGFNLPSPLWMGLFGLGTQPVIYSNYGNYSSTPYFVSLRDQKLIPSLSWSFTAGATYRFSSGQYAQLIFGGYDTARYQPNDVDFTLSADVTRDIVVGVQSISYSGQNSLELLPEPIYAFIESTDPNIWLPLDACHMFEQAFGLTYDDVAEKYLMNTTHFSALWSQNPSVSFRLAVGTVGGATVDIVLPFKAFGLKATYPFVANDTYYFPLKRAGTAPQYTLGRAFLQEAYLTVDYGRGNFSVSQCVWNAGAKAQVHTILDSTYVANNTNTTKLPGVNNTKEKSSVGPAVGSALGGIGVFAIVAGLIFCWRRRKSKSQHEKEQNEDKDASVALEELKDSGGMVSSMGAEFETKFMNRKPPGSIYTDYSRQEADGELAADGHEIHQLSAESKATELANTDFGERYELESSLPVELAGDSTYTNFNELDRDARLSPLGHQNSVGSVGSSSGLLMRQPMPLSRTGSADTRSSRGHSVSPLLTPVPAQKIPDLAGFRGGARR